MEVAQSPTPRGLLTVGALVATALAVAFLFIGVAHSLIVLTSGNVGEDQLRIDQGRWDLAAGSVVIFLALIPMRLKRDWRSHGLYAAFVVSLFAEMFGFPLTAYFLSSFLGLAFFERKFMLYMY